MIEFAFLTIAAIVVAVALCLVFERVDSFKDDGIPTPDADDIHPRWLKEEFPLVHAVVDQPRSAEKRDIYLIAYENMFLDESNFLRQMETNDER